jgi:hypothetical protein
VSSNSFFPTTEAGQGVWLTNFALKLPVQGPVCGIGAEEITGTTGGSATGVWIDPRANGGDWAFPAIVS